MLSEKLRIESKICRDMLNEKDNMPKRVNSVIYSRSCTSKSV